MSPPAAAAKAMFSDDESGSGSGSDSGSEDSGSSSGSDKTARRTSSKATNVAGKGADVLTINKKFAERFEHNKRREETHRLQEKVKREYILRPGDVGEASDSETSSSESDEGDVPAKFDAQFAEALLKIKTKDPAIYREDAELFSSDDDDDDDDANVVFEKEYAPMQIKVNKKKVYDIAFFTCDSKGTTIEIDVAYETLNGGKHHLSTEWQPVVSVFLYILLCYVIFFMLQLTHTMSMCAIYRSQSVVSALHYAMWTTQVVRMIHVSMSFNHFNYIDVNGTVSDSFYHGVIICSSLKEMTFWTLLLAIGGGWRVTSNRASRERKIIGGVTMFMIFTTNLVGQMNLGIRTVYFVYALTYCGVISMTLYVSSKTIRTLHEQLEIFRRSGATEEEVARAPVRTKERMYQTFYVAFIVFCGLKIMNPVSYTHLTLPTKA